MNRKILLVEDEALIAMDEAAMLEENGYEVLTAYSGENAIDAVHQNNIDCILMDIDLGDGRMDGTEAAGAILKDHDIPVVFLSSHTEPEVVEKTEKITSYGYIVKNSGDTVILASLKMAFRLFEANQHIREHEETLITEKEKLQHYIEVIEERQRIDKEKQKYLMKLYDKIDLQKEELFDFVLDATIQLTNSEYGFSGFMNADESVMMIHRWSKGTMEECSMQDQPIVFPIDKAGIWGDCVRERKPVIVNDYRHSSRAVKHGTPRGHVEIKRFLCVPVFDGDKIVAVGAVANKDLPYDISDADAVTLIYDKMWTLIAKQEQEKKLEESENRFHQLFNTMKEGVAIYRAVEGGEDFEFVNINDAGLTYGNKRRDDVIGRCLTTIYPGIKKIGLLDVFKEVYQTGKPQHYPLTRYEDEVTKVWVENYVFRLPSDLVVAVYEDTTELHKEEQRYKTIVKTTMDGFWLFDKQGVLVDVNDAYCRMSGYSRQELLGMRVPQLDAEETETEFAEHLQRVMKEGYSRFESTHIRKDGTHFPVDISVTYVPFGAEGQCIVFLRDISERRRLDEAIRGNEKELNLTLNATTDGIWKWNFLTNELEFSSRYYTMLGYEPKEFPASFTSWKEMIHPDDLDGAMEAANTYLQTKSEKYENEFRLRTKEGAYRWVRAQGRVVESDADGKAVRMIGNHVDITVQKQYEDKLLSQRRMLQTIIDKAHTQLVYLDRDFIFIAVNSRYAESCRRKPEELLGKNHFYFFPHEENEQIFRRVRDTGRAVSFKDKPFRFPDQPERGVTYWDWTLSPVFDDDGRVEGLVFSLVETTDRKRAEEQKVVLMKELNHRVKNNLLMINSLISLKESALGETVDLSDVTHQIDAIRIIHEKLYGVEDITSINAGDYIRDLLSTVFSFCPRDVTIESNIEVERFSTGTAVPLGLIINEVATNAIKYGFTAEAEPRFSVAMMKGPDDDRYILSLSNNGKPFPEDIDFDHPNTLGLRLITALVAQLDGTIELQRDPHPIFTVRFPVD